MVPKEHNRTMPKHSSVTDSLKSTIQPITKSEQLDVDIRFLLANERTLLAWIRTCLALQAGGVAIMHFGNAAQNKVGISLIIFGACTAVIGYLRYRLADQAIRGGELPRAGFGPLFETCGVLILAIVLTMAYQKGF